MIDMSTRKWVNALATVTVLGLLSAAILLYIDYNTGTKFTLVSAPKQEEVESPIGVNRSEVNFAEIDLGNNLAFKKKVTASGHTQDYMEKNAVDGDVKTYWEGTPDSYPNILVIDLESLVDIKAIRVKLNPNNMWERRKQTLSIHCSPDDKTYTNVIEETDYLFDPVSGNAVIINFDRINTRYLRLEFAANTAATGGQAAEIEIY